MSAIDQKRIAKNTLLLYVRIGVVMLVGLYTSRVVLDALGEVDYGVYSAVGTIVLMFSFLNSTLASVCQRFFSFEMGRDDYLELHHTFCISLLVFVVLAVVVVVLLETAGMWFLNNKMQLAGRYDAAVLVYHCATASFVFQILRTPYMGMVVAREKMKVFAYISVIEAAATLLAAILLQHSTSDRLVFYAVLILGVQVIVSAAYYLYCRLCYTECRYKFYFDKKKFLELFSFTGWETFSGMAVVARNYGLNLLINMFFGPILNTPRQVAQKVYMSILQLQSNFYLAVKPQIIKSYASGAVNEMQGLLCQSIRFSYYLLLVASVPLLMETQFVLDIWLKDVPQYAVLFTRLMIINGLIDVVVNPLGAAIQASGRIKWYQLFYGSTLLLILPLSYVGLKVFRFGPESVFYIPIVVAFFAQFIRVYFAKRLAQVSIRSVWHSVRCIILVTVVSFVLPILLSDLMPDNFGKSFVVLVSSFLWTLICIYVIGITSDERKQFNSAVLKKFQFYR